MMPGFRATYRRPRSPRPRHRRQRVKGNPVFDAPPPGEEQRRLPSLGSEMPTSVDEAGQRAIAPLPLSGPASRGARFRGIERAVPLPPLRPWREERRPRQHLRSPVPWPLPLHRDGGPGSRRRAADPCVLGPPCSPRPARSTVCYRRGKGVLVGTARRDARQGRRLRRGPPLCRMAPAEAHAAAASFSPFHDLTRRRTSLNVLVPPA